MLSISDFFSEEGRPARGVCTSLLAGILFAAGWWVLIDGFNMGVNVVRDPQSSAAAGYAWLPPFAASVMYLMLNGMLWSELSEDNLNDASTVTKARLFLFAALLIGFAGIVGAAFLMANQFTTRVGAYNWAGVSCLASTLMIVAAAFFMRFTTLPHKN